MSEIARLRTRLKHVGAKALEYRMTVTEARELLKEVDELLKQIEKPPEVVVNEPAIINIIMDGGSLE